MSQRRFTIGNAIYLSIILGMLSATALNFSINLIFDNGEEFYFKIIVTIFLICLSVIILTSRKLGALPVSQRKFKLRINNSKFQLVEIKFQMRINHT
jgi:hypothetical protein